MRSFFPRPRIFQVPRPGFRSIDGFSLLEILISLMILMIVFVAVLQFVSDVARTWKSTAEDPFIEAQDAFEVVAQNLSTATLEPYQDYADRNGAFRSASAAGFRPDHLARRSDLDFVCIPANDANGPLAGSKRIVTGSGVFFLAPHGYTQTYAHQGMDHLLDALGYFVEFSDADEAPAFFSSHHAWRWRLKQIAQPAESLGIFAAGPSSSTAWIQQAVQPGAITPVLGENIVTLLALPERAADDPGATLSPDFRYDSRDAGSPLTHNQLPPRVRLILVAIDATSAEQLALKYGSKPPPLVPGTLFQNAEKLDTDLATLDAMLTAQKVGHRVFQRDLSLSSAAWSETPSL